MDRARIVAHDAPYDPWPQAMTVNEEIRAIQRKSRGVGIRSPHPGRGGRAPHELPRSGSLNSGCKPQKWKPISPAGLAYIMRGLKSREKSADFSGHPHPLTARSHRLLA